MKFTAITSIVALCLSAVTAQDTTTAAPPNAGIAIIDPLLNVS